MKKVFFGTWIVVSIIFFFFSPWNYFGPCYGKVCSDYSAPPVFSVIPNFMQPACTGLCLPLTHDEFIFSAPNLILDVFLGFIISGVVFLSIKSYRRKRAGNEAR